MKKGNKILIAFLILVCGANISFSQADTTFIRPTYNLYAKQITFDPNELVFDIYIKHTNPTETRFEYAGGQYYFNFTQAFRNGGTLSFFYKLGASNDTISQLVPRSLIPRNPSISPDTTFLRMAINVYPGAGNGMLIPDTGNGGYGIQVIRVSFKNLTTSFLGAPGNNIRWRNFVTFYTKIFAYTGVNGTVNTEVTDSNRHFVDFLTDITPAPVANFIPREFSVSQNYPNPFNPSTNIEYSLPVEGKVTLRIYDITGREVMLLVNDVKPVGVHTARFNGANLASGVYFYRLNVEGIDNKKFEATKRMVLIK